MQEIDKQSELKRTNNKLAWQLGWIVLAGLVFGFALAPLYDVMCKKFGFNGKADTSASAFSASQKVDKTRTVTVLFTGNTMPGLTWSFHPTQNSMQVHPGEIKMTTYVAKNNGDASVMGVAVPSVTPEIATLSFKKIECFCFKQQTLNSGESKVMPLRFYVSPDLPKDINTITLSYAFFNGLPASSQAALNKVAEGEAELN